MNSSRELCIKFLVEGARIEKHSIPKDSIIFSWQKNLEHENSVWRDTHTLTRLHILFEILIIKDIQ